MSHILAFFILFCDRKKGGERVRNRIYLRPELYDLSQGTRIKFVRIFRHLTQNNISDDLGITGENKRRTLTRYEKGDRNPSKSRLQELSNILLVNDNLIKQYEFKVYTGEFGSKNLTTINNDSIISYDTIMDVMEAGKNAYEERKDIYESFKK